MDVFVCVSEYACTGVCVSVLTGYSRGCVYVFMCACMHAWVCVCVCVTRFFFFFYAVAVDFAGSRLVIERLVVKNEGWPLVVLKGEELAKASPEIAMRGFVFERRQTYVAENSDEGTTKVIREEI